MRATAAAPPLCCCLSSGPSPMRCACCSSTPANAVAKTCLAILTTPLLISAVLARSAGLTLHPSVASSSVPRCTANVHFQGYQKRTLWAPDSVFAYAFAYAVGCVCLKTRYFSIKAAANVSLYFYKRTAVAFGASQLQLRGHAAARSTRRCSHTFPHTLPVPGSVCCPLTHHPERPAAYRCFALLVAYIRCGTHGLCGSWCCVYGGCCAGVDRQLASIPARQRTQKRCSTCNGMRMRGAGSCFEFC